MSDIKRQLFKEIDERIAKKKEAAARAITRNTIEAFVLAFISNIEDINMLACTMEDWQFQARTALHALQMQVESYDRDAHVDAVWHSEDDKLPVVNGVLIKWSKAYQDKQSCDPELFLDATQLLFN